MLWKRIQLAKKSFLSNSNGKDRKKFVFIACCICTIKIAQRFFLKNPNENTLNGELKLLVFITASMEWLMVGVLLSVTIDTLKYHLFYFPFAGLHVFLPIIWSCVDYYLGEKIILLGRCKINITIYCYF